MPHHLSHVCSLALAAAAAALCALPAHAQSASASAAITSFSYRLVDLDLADGITPSIALTPISGFTRLSHSMYGNSAMNEFQSIGTLGTTASGRAFGSASTTSGVDFMQAMAQFSAPAGAGYQSFGGENEYRFNFTLTPSTGLAFSGDVSLAAHDSGGPVQALAGMRMQGLFPWTPSGLVDYTAFNWTAGVEDGARAERFYGELRTGAIGLQGYFRMTNHATVISNALLPIPEPQTYAMLLAGLALLGVCARRQRRRAA